MIFTSSPQTLFQLINASPNYYRVFLLSKRRILSDLIHQILLPEVIHDARAAVVASRFERRGLAENLRAFIQTYEIRRNLGSSNRLIPLSSCIAICQLHISIEYFVQDLVERAAIFLAQSGFSFGIDCLSWTERGRLRRSFHRFQLFSCLSHSTFRDKPGFNSYQQAAFFLALFAAYELEELSCIYEYFRGRLCEMYDRLEDEHVETVIADWAQGNESVSVINEENER